MCNLDVCCNGSLWDLNYILYLCYLYNFSVCIGASVIYKYKVIPCMDTALVSIPRLFC